MVESLFFGGLLRFAQSLLQAAPFIVIGLITAGIFRRLLGYQQTRQLFGASTWRSLPQAWALGMLLPVCSLGVIPVARELRKARLSGGTILAFALSAPLFNPLSLLYGLTLSEPVTILAFALCSLVVVTAVGLLWDRWSKSKSLPTEEPRPVAYGWKRLVAVVTAGAREAAGGSLGYIVVGLVGVVLLALVLPPSSLQRSVNGDNPLAPIVMLFIAVPAYATPMLAMSQLGTMFQHGNSIGAAFTLLVFGAGVNLGIVLWIVRSFGMRKGIMWFALLIGVVLSLSYAVEPLLYPDEVEAADHTHAFDRYCAPFGAEAKNPASLAWQKLKSDVQPYELAGLAGLAAYFILGIGLRLFDSQERLEQWLEREPAPAASRSYDVVLPRSVVGGCALLGLVAFSVLGCFAYYPAPSEAFAEMQICRTEALGSALSADYEAAGHWLPIYEDWLRKLKVGVYLRQWRLSDYHRMKTQLVEDRLELLEHELEHRDSDEVRRLVNEVLRADGRMRRAYEASL